MDIEANEIQIRDFNGKKVLILVCELEEQSETLHEWTGDEDNYEIRVYKHPVNKNVSIGLTIKNMGVMLRVDSSHNEDNYPPVKWLYNGEVSFLSFGYLDDKRQLYYTPLKPLTSLIEPSQLN